MIKQTKMILGKYEILQNSPFCFVIAEIGHNHQGNIVTARKLVDAAYENGAHAVKLQKRNNNILYTKEIYNKPYDHENSFGKTYGEHREALEFGEKEYRELKEYAQTKGLVFFATAFDFDSVDFLEEIGVSAYKIASGDITNHPLINYIASKKKPVFIGTGASDFDEVKAAYDVAKRHTEQICIMQCTSAYPAEPADIHLNVIKTYLKEFPEAVIGYSGHDNGIILPAVAYVLGARVIEKHFTLSRAMKGNDHKFSLEPVGLRKMARDLDRVSQAMGSYEKKCYDFEIEARKKMGKSIVLTRSLKKDDTITEDAITFKSPGCFIPPSKIKEVMGKRVIRDLEEDTVLTFEDLI